MATTSAAFSGKQQLPPLPILVEPEDRPPLPRGMLVDLYDRYSFQANLERKLVSEEFFQAVLHQASNPHWFGDSRIPNDFRNRHAMITMHIWFLHKRLIHDGADAGWAKGVQDELFDILWDDTRSRVRQVGSIPELLVAKNVQKVQQYTWIHLTHYDHVYTEFLEQPERRLEELQKLVARHVLLWIGKDGDDKSAYENLQWTEAELNLLNRLAWYIDAQYQNICLEWPEDDYRQGRVAWVSPPALPGTPHEADVELPEGWRTNLTLRGETYYWHTVTNEVSWEPPTPPMTSTSSASA